MTVSRKLLEKQIAKATRPDGHVDLPRLAALVIDAYEDYERDRKRTDRSIGLMVEENDQLTIALESTVKELAVQNSRFQAALENMSHGLSMFDEDDRLVVANGPFCAMFGLGPDRAVTGAPLIDLLGPDFAETVTAAKQSTRADGTVKSAPRALRREWRLPDGRIIDMAITSLRSGGWVAVHNDVTEQRDAEAKIIFMARHDTLTGLANRLMFREEMERRLLDLAPGQQLAILYLDLDHFKAVNDTLGHPMGDKLLRSAARSLSTCVGAGDIVARLGGDEFAIIQGAVPQPGSSTFLARRIIAAIGHPFAIEGQQINVGTSVGIAVAPLDGSDADKLLKNADMALYRAKADGRSTFRYFEPGMEAKLQARRALEADLRGAIGNGELELLYQPIVTLADGSIRGFEALLRWNHPTRGRVPPAEFIPVAEETGLILQIGEWVLDRACAEAATWPSHVKVAVNVSPMQIKSKVLAFVVVGALARSGLSPLRLELEITEAVLLQENDQTLTTLHQLRNLGVRISMDDFGTGYSSLSYLRSFPFDKIKIDQSFVRDIGRKPDGLVIIRAIAGLGKSLGMLTTIEGVETEEQLEAVRREGFIEMQGFLASKPQPASEIPRLLGERLWAENADGSLMIA